MADIRPITENEILSTFSVLKHNFNCSPSEAVSVALGKITGNVFRMLDTLEEYTNFMEQGQLPITYGNLSKEELRDLRKKYMAYDSFLQVCRDEDGKHESWESYRDAVVDNSMEYFHKMGLPLVKQLFELDKA